MRIAQNHLILLTGLFLFAGCDGEGNQNSGGNGGNGGSAGSGASGGSGGSGGGSSIQIEKPENAIEGQYIFVLDNAVVTPDKVQSTANELLMPQSGVLLQTYAGSLMGFAAKNLDDTKALAIAKDPRVKAIGQDARVELLGTQMNAPWNLDRLDSKPLVLDTQYEYTATGKGVHVYVIDTGINDAHVDFGGRVTGGTETIGDGQGTKDCHYSGHGTHVAGIVGSATWGVAKEATLHPVRVIECNNGTGSLSTVIAGMDWVTKNHVKPAVANLSIGAPRFTIFDTALAASIQAGVTYVVSAHGATATPEDACTAGPSAGVPEAIIVGATDKSDNRFHGIGPCVDIYAPGKDIVSTAQNSNMGTLTFSGVSMAAPHVAGVVATFLQVNPAATPAAVTTAVLGAATTGAVQNTMGGPDALLFSRFVEFKQGFVGLALWSSEVTAADGVFNVPKSYGTMQYADITGDGKDDFCVRYHSAMGCMTNSGTSFGKYTDWSIYFDDAPFGTNQSNWGTIRLPDLNGDGKADICGRRGDGVICALSDGTAFQNIAIWTPGFADAAGWTDPKYWVSIDFPDVNGDGKADICGRGSNGVHCGLSTGTAFGTTSIWTPNFEDAAGWAGNVNLWSTIRFPDVNGDGKADVCGRGTTGIFCALSDGTKFSPATQWETSFGDGSGFDVMESYWGTLQYADVNGDKRMDACARASGGVYCELSDGNKFGTLALWSPAFADASGWAGLQSLWGTIRFPDVNGDGKADVCGRSSLGVFCELSSGTTFSPGTLWEPNFSDASGYASQPYYWGSLRYPDVNGDGKADICGLADNGINCAFAP